MRKIEPIRQRESADEATDRQSLAPTLTDLRLGNYQRVDRRRRNYLKIGPGTRDEHQDAGEESRNRRREEYRPIGKEAPPGPQRS